MTAIQHGRPASQLQALTTALKLMAEEGKSPLKPVGEFSYYFPLHRLKLILMSILSPNHDTAGLIARFQEVTGYTDALFYTWRVLHSITPKRQPQEFFIKNFLELVHKLPLPMDNEGIGFV